VLQVDLLGFAIVLADETVHGDGNVGSVGGVADPPFPLASAPRLVWS